MKGELGCQSASTSFGLTPQYRIRVHKHIFELVYYSKGGFDHDAAYSMPVYLRNFYLNELIETIKKEADSIRKSTKPKPGTHKKR